MLFRAEVATMAFVRLFFMPWQEDKPISIPVGGMKAHMHFMSHGIAGGYPRPCPEISPSLLADISAFARRYLRPWPIMLRLIPPTGGDLIIQASSAHSFVPRRLRHGDVALSVTSRLARLTVSPCRSSVMMLRGYCDYMLDIQKNRISQIRKGLLALLKTENPCVDNNKYGHNDKKQPDFLYLCRWLEVALSVHNRIK